MILQRFLIYANIGLFTVILAKEQGTTVDFTELYRQEGDLITILNDWIWLVNSVGVWKCDIIEITLYTHSRSI